MKLGELVIGTEYGVIDPQRGRHYKDLPRQCVLMEIKKVPETYFETFSSTPRVRNISTPVVKFLDAARARQERWHGRRVQTAKKGSKMQVEPKQIVALWSDLKDEVAEKVATVQTQAEVAAQLRSRIAKLGLNRGNATTYATVRIGAYRNAGIHVSLDVMGKDVERILSLAEAGKAALNA